MWKIKPIIYLQLVFLILTSCNKKNNTLKDVLDKAGNNKQELEKVLDYYKANPADSLKYKAAVFLIKNMPYHSFIKPIEGFQGAFDSIQNYPKNNTRRDVFGKILDSVSQNVVIKNEVKTLDIEYVKFNYLINNIELAFKAWYRIPKNKRASFDDFCNYILPYRNSDEPLDPNSRKKLLKKYSWVYDFLDKGASLKSVVDSVTSGFGYINMIQIRKYYPIPLSIAQIEKAKFGLCDDGVNYYVNVFRALGIVCAKDMVTHWGNHPYSGHSWVYTKYGKGILHYPNMGVNTVYIAASIDNNSFHPVNYPFFIDNRKQIHYLEPTEKYVDSVGLTRKIGLSTPRNRTKIDWIRNLNGGIFEGANNPKFNNSKIIYQISNLNSVQLQKNKINSTEKFKYVRFNSNGKEAFLSSLFFYGKKGEKLNGEVF